jgi:hypothetical protein
MGTFFLKTHRKEEPYEKALVTTNHLRVDTFIHRCFGGKRRRATPARQESDAPSNDAAVPAPLSRWLDTLVMLETALEQIEDEIARTPLSPSRRLKLQASVNHLRRGWRRGTPPHESLHALNSYASGLAPRNTALSVHLETILGWIRELENE